MSNLVTRNVNVVYLSQIVLEHSSLDPDPLLGLESGLLLHHPHDVSHLLDWNHLLLVDSHPQVGYPVDGGLHVSLLERLDVDVTLHVLRGNNGPGEVQVKIGRSKTELPVLKILLLVHIRKNLIHPCVTHFYNRVWIFGFFNTIIRVRMNYSIRIFLPLFISKTIRII